MFSGEQNVKFILLFVTDLDFVVCNLIVACANKHQTTHKIE